MRFAIPVILILLGVFQQMNAQDTNPIKKVYFNQLEASQYNIGENGVAWSSSSTLSNFFKLYTTGWFKGDYWGPGADGILKYASNNAPPSIYGANGFFGIGSDTNANVQHLLDNHHRVSGLYLLTTIFTNGYSATVTVTNASGVVITTNIGAAPNYTYVNQTNDWSYMDPTQFWSNMLAGEGGTNFAPVSTNANGFWSTTNQPTFLWAYNKGVPQIPTNTPPPMIPGLEDDTLRDVAAQVNYPGDYGFKLKGYQNRDEAEQFDFQGDDGPGEVLFYQEFWWANYLREYVYIPTISNRETAGMNSNAPYQFTDYTQLIAFSADFLCHSSNAAHLPGYYDPGLTSVDFPAFSQGSSFLIGTNGSLDVSGNMFIDQAATLTVKGALSVTNETFYVGKVTSNNTLIISDGGVVTNNNAVIGSSAAATNNSALITGSGSAWFLYGDLIVGEFGSANSMTISNGGQVTNGLSTLGSVIGFGGDSTGNSVLVTGTNVSGVASLWTCVNDLTVGWSGSSNSLRITQGGGVTSYIGIIGDDTNATGNSAVVDGSGSYWSNSNVLLIGVSGSGNSLLITNRGQVMAVNSDIGVNAGSTANMVTVSGVGSVLTNSGDLTVGYSGSSNTLTVSARAKVFSSNSYIGRDPGSTGNTVIVTGTGSLWTNSGDLYVGNQGASNNLVISSGGMVINGGQDSTGGVIGFITNSSNNSVVVTGSGSTWLSAGDVVIGYSGIGNRLEVSNGGTVSNGVVNYAGGLSGGIIGFNEGSTDNSVLVTGTGSRWISSGDLFVGFNGAGNSMVISNGGSIYNSQVDFGGVLGWGAASSNNTVIVTDAGSTWTNSGNLTVGYEGSGNSMVISNRGTVAVASNSYIGNASTSSNNSVLVTGANSLWTNSGAVTIGAGGAEGNTLTVADGGQVVASEIVVNAGRLQADASNAFGLTPLITLGGGSGAAATFGFSTNVSINSLTRQSNSLLAPSSGAVLNINGNLNAASGYGAFDLSDYYTVGTNDVVTFGSQSGLDVADLRVASGNTNWSFQTNANAIQLIFNQQVYAGSDLYVGSYSPGNFVDFFAVETNSYDNTYVGYGATASNNTLTVANAGTLLTNSAVLYVGNEGSGNTMKVANAGTVASFISYIGNSSTSSNNSVLVTGTSSALNTAILGVGYDGSGNSLVIADGGTVAVASFDIFIGYGSTSSNNSLLVTGTSSLLTNRIGNGLFVGHYGSSNSMVISNGGTVAVASDSLIGWGAASSNNSVLVTGPDSLWTNSSYQRLGNAGLVVGYGGSGNSLIISNGGTVAVVFDSLIGYESTSSNNSVLVTDVGSLWTNSGDLFIGKAGSGNSLVISNGGKVFNAMGYIGSESTATGNLVTVTGSNSSWINSGDLYVGYAGQSNRLVISDGGFVSNVNGFDDGVDPTDAYNSVLVTGSGSRWVNSGNLTFGLAGHDNSLVISDGGMVSVGGNSTIGDQSTASNNSVLVAGANSLWTNSYGLLVGGEGSSNSLVISNGGTVANIYGYVGVDTNSSNNSVLVTGSNSLWTNSGDLSVGGSGSGNSLVISNGGMVANYSANIGFDTVSSNNSVLVTGSNSLWTNSSNLYVGNYGSRNSLVISNGGMVASSVGYIGVATSSSNNSVLVMEVGSLWTISSDLYVGVEGSGNNLVISNGGMVANYSANIGFDTVSSNNCVLVTGEGSLWTNAVELYVGNAGSGNNLTIANSGSVAASSITIASQTGSSGTLNIGRFGTNDSAGTITAPTITFGSGTGTINFNQTNTLTLSSDISGNGSVNQLGNGTTILSGNNSYTGTTLIRAGTVQAASMNAFGTSAVTLTNTGTLSLSSNLTIDSLIWDSSATIALPYLNGGEYLNITGALALSGSGAGTFDLSGNRLGANPVQLMAWGTSNSYTTDQFSVTGWSSYLLSISNNALWIASLDLYVGSNSSVSPTNFTSGTNTYGNTYVGYTADASNNLLTIGNTNTVLTNAGLLYVGYDGSSNSMVISNGGRVANEDGIIGLRTNSSNNSVLVTGSNSLWTNSGGLSVGEGGSGNSLTVADGGTVASDSGIIGSYDTYTSSNNSVLVTGSGSLWTNNSDLVVGADISGNSLVISNGGKVANTDGFIGDTPFSSNNSVLVTGSNSLWTNAGGLFIGNYGSGTLTIANSGSVAASSITIASQSNSTGTLNIGRFGTNDTAGTITAPTITFGSGTGTINFNQTKAFTLSSDISGNGSVNQLGRSQKGKFSTILSGNNTYTGTTLISGGTLQAASTNAFGTSAVTLTDRGILSLSTNLTIASLIWSSSKSVISLTPGAQQLTIDGALTSGGGGVFDFGGYTNSGTNTIITFGTNSGFNVDDFSVVGSKSDLRNWSFLLTGNSLSAWYISGGGGGGNITNSGNQTISGNTTNASLTITAGTTVVTQAATATFTNQVTVDSGVLDINGTVVTPTATIETSGTLMGSGTLQLTGGNLYITGMLAPGNSPGTFFVNGGNLVMGSTAIWDQQIYSASVYDRVVVTGSAILNGTMNITTDGVTQLQFGQKYNFLTASGGISGAFSSIMAPEGFRGRLLLSGDNTQANILIAPASYTQLAANRNQSNVATALNSFIPYTSGDQMVVSTSLDSLTASQYNQAFNAIMPTFYQQIATIAFNNANAQNMQLVQRLWGLRVAEGGGFSMSGLADNMPLLEGQGDGSTGKGVLDSKKDILRPGLDNHWGMFVDGNGIFAQANSGNMLPGYNSQSGGVTTGLTYKWNENVGTGIYCGYQGTYTKSGADGSGLGTGSRLIDNAVRFGVFGTYGQKDGKGLFVNALAGGGYHNFQATRIIQYTGMNRTANSAPGAGELDTMLAAGYDIKKGKFTFGPTASLQYTYLGVNSLNETGAQSLSFNSGGWNSSSMLSSVGAHAAYSWVANKNVVVVPQVNLSWQHEFMQNPYAISGNLGGTSPTFSNWSATPIRDFLYTGVGFTVEFAKKWNTSFFYNAAAGNSDLVSQNIFWSAGIKF